MKAIHKNTFVRIAVLAMILFFSVVFITLRLQHNDLKQQAQDLQSQIAAMSEVIYELEADIARPYDDEYIAEIAHEQLGLCYPQEIIYISGEGH
ncbi:MAG: septum formation initiator family protein [Clostridia bacterium]|nr:septum formation initiator family protein [Clostridia bacterium]